MAVQRTKRRFARAKERLPVRLFSEKKNRSFEASVYTHDISVSGVFIASEFFLKQGTQLDLEFQMPNDKRVLRTRGVIVREVRADRELPGSPRKVSGFAVKFTKYHADAKTALASAFMFAEVDLFIEDYLSRRTKTHRNEHERLLEVIVAWEIARLEMPTEKTDLLRETVSLDKQGRVRRRQTRQLRS